ncbi:GNAT family N-acetyltransferase [Terracidiphilus gabretensis]|uniref:GNAT family N-acetyltransferase n=1 Tax=Terracidiphilus gabretensis TaxID=1577687 RepID=UPI00071B5185|nr:GNAT family N-acetyltransferase [Terracidiphilus gabretensis]
MQYAAVRVTSGVSYEVLDLRHFMGRALRLLLEAEERVWTSRLHWDYRPSAKLLLQYLDSRMLPGYAAVDSGPGPGPGRVAAYAFCVYEDTKAVVGDVFADPDIEHWKPPASSFTGQSPLEIEETLLRHLLETLQHSPHVNRIESQLLVHPSGRHEAGFRTAGFDLYRRLFMIRNLDGFDQWAQIELPTGFEMRSWRDDDMQPASRLISECYAGHPDSHINDQYRTPIGSLRFLQNIVRFSGCGTFSPSVSHLVFEHGGREPVALMLGSRVSTHSGHITQLCVRPQDRGRGLGKMLLAVAAQGFLKHDIREISLTVTEANSTAVDLYRREGYQVAHTFDAGVWEKS